MDEDCYVEATWSGKDRRQPPQGRGYGDTGKHDAAGAEEERQLLELLSWNPRSLVLFYSQPKWSTIGKWKLYIFRSYWYDPSREQWDTTKHDFKVLPPWCHHEASRKYWRVSIYRGGEKHGVDSEQVVFEGPTEHPTEKVVLELRGKKGHVITILSGRFSRSTKCYEWSGQSEGIFKPTPGNDEWWSWKEHLASERGPVSGTGKKRPPISRRGPWGQSLEVNWKPRVNVSKEQTNKRTKTMVSGSIR